MDSSNEMEVAPDGSTRVQRACDPCRTRKIRCDRGTPCSNCKASKLHCQTSVPAQKAPKQRVHISDEYEKKIDRIEDRLAGIENVLESLAAKLGDLDISKRSSEEGSQSKPKSQSSTFGRSPHSSNEIRDATPAPFEGETTLNSQSVFAREFLERAVGTAPSVGQNAEVQAALASLQNLVSKQSELFSTKNEPRPFINKAFADIDAAKLERPPWDAIEDILDKASIYPTMCFAVVFPFVKLLHLRDMFKEAFDAPEECTAGRRILVYGVLHNLFTEFAYFPLLGQKMESFLPYARHCKINMEIAMSQLDLFLPASYENILALVLASHYAIELGKPSLCWVMNSTAAGLCQNLGYHRISSMKDDNEEERSAKITVFWFIYLVDKNLSLSLGRASAIQDWDMSLPYPVCSGKRALAYRGATGTEMQMYWIKVAQIQGQTYEKLFSPAASLRSPEERAEIARGLASAMDQAWAERGDATVLDFTGLGQPSRDSIPKVPLLPVSPNDQELPSERMRGRPLMFPTPAQISSGVHPELLQNIERCFRDVGDLFYYADVVVHYSIITLIQRAASEDGVFNQECLKSARAALLAHQRCSQRFNKKGNEDLWSGYVHWSILQAPFTPFIVLFCHAISACSYTDLASLTDFVLSLESCRTITEGADKLYRLCQLFLSVAKLYVEAKTNEASEDDRTLAAQGGNLYTTADGQIDLSSVNQFDPFLSALGLVPNAAWPMASFASEQPGFEGSSQGMDGTGGTNQNPMSGGMNQNAVQDWYSGSRYIMGLLEEDITMPDLNF